MEEATGLKIRKAEANDALAIHQVFTNSIFGIGGGHYSDPQKQAWAEAVVADSWSTRILELQFYVAECEAHIVGFISWFEGEIVHVYVGSEFSGRGIGHQLMDYALAHLRDRSVTLTSSLNALPFYEKHGFETIERIEKERGGILIQCIRMKRPSVFL